MFAALRAMGGGFTFGEEDEVGGSAGLSLFGDDGAGGEFDVVGMGGEGEEGGEGFMSFGFRLLIH